MVGVPSPLLAEDSRCGSSPLLARVPWWRWCVVPRHSWLRVVLVAVPRRSWLEPASRGGGDAFPWGAWPRDAAVTRTSKQAGKALRSQGHQLRSCHETKRFRILATLKQVNKSMYSNTSGYVHMGLRLDWGKGITGQ